MKPRFEPIKQFPQIGEPYWIVWDNLKNELSTQKCFRVYKTRKDCREAIKKAYQKQLIK